MRKSRILEVLYADTVSKPDSRTRVTVAYRSVRFAWTEQDEFSRAANSGGLSLSTLYSRNLQHQEPMRRVARILPTGNIHGSQLSLAPACTPASFPRNFFLTYCLKWYIIVNFHLQYVRRIFFQIWCGYSPLPPLATPGTAEGGGGTGLHKMFSRLPNFELDLKMKRYVRTVFTHWSISIMEPALPPPSITVGRTTYPPLETFTRRFPLFI